MDNLIDYLNDHLAGSVVALELLDHLIENSEQGRFKIFCEHVREEVQADQDKLRELIGRLGECESLTKKAVAWIAEKAAQIKLMLAGEDERGLGRVQALEGLMLGITGKKALWTALAQNEELAEWVKGMDLERLIERANEQIDLVEAERLVAARKSFCAVSEKSR